MIELGRQLRVEGIEINSGNDIPIAIATILRAVLKANIDNEDLLASPPASGQKTFPGVKYFHASTVRMVEGRLELGTSSIPIPPAVKIPDLPLEEEKYIERAMEAYAEYTGSDVLSYERRNELPPLLRQHLIRQRANYWSAVGRERVLREIVADGGDEHFESLKDDLDDAVYNVWMNPDHQDGYRRMLSTLQQAAEHELNGSALARIEGLFSAKEKQGIAQILVNEERIMWILE